MTDAEKAYQYFVTAVPENEEQAKAYFWARKALLASVTQPNEWEREGLYGKYTVYKNKDGSLVTDCFILRPAKDPAAVAALRAYAATTDNAELAADIINWVGAEPNEPLTVTEVCPHCESEITMEWNVKTLGYKAYCPVCGNRLMLCDECQHGEPGHICDYDSNKDTCGFNRRSPEGEEET